MLVTGAGLLVVSTQARDNIIFLYFLVFVATRHGANLVIMVTPGMDYLGPLAPGPYEFGDNPKVFFGKTRTPFQALNVHNISSATDVLGIHFGGEVEKVISAEGFVAEVRVMRPCKTLFALPVATALLLSMGTSTAQPASEETLYESACAACHGEDGNGRASEEVAFEVLPPEFTDCEFASREPDPDWFAVIHEGGPVRAFDRMMPAFGDALSEDEIWAILRHVRTFCTDGNWPRGEFNLPRPIYTEKAFPEDETVVTAQYDTGDSSAWEIEFLYEKRFGPRGMIEIAVPLAGNNFPGESSNQGLGDIAIGYKYALYHNLEAGHIFSAGIEGIFPTGDEDSGLGKGTTVIEPFVAWGWLLPADMFLQTQLLGEFPTESGFNDEVGLRVVLGKTFTGGGEFGRAISPMLEVLSSRELESGADTNVDLAPQVQIALNVRQHILLNMGARIPANNTSGRDTVWGVYLLWDWFDGGFFDGW